MFCFDNYDHNEPSQHSKQLTIPVGFPGTVINLRTTGAVNYSVQIKACGFTNRLVCVTVSHSGTDCQAKHPFREEYNTRTRKECNS